jgi:hypothetical protein
MAKDDTAKQDPSEWTTSNTPQSYCGLSSCIPRVTTPDGAKRRPSLAEQQHMEEVINDVVGHE